MSDVYEIARAGLELAEKATPGPWRTFTGASFQRLPMVCSVACEIYVLSKDEPGDYAAFPNQALIAHAGTHYAALCRALLAQKAVVDAAVAYAQAIETHQPRCAVEENIKSAVRAMKERTR